MNPEECRRILGVAADAEPDAVRQAYIDLARVWHPDRFQSDERLRRIAEEHFQQVAEAYAGLKNWRPSQAAPTGSSSVTVDTTAVVEEPPFQTSRPVWIPQYYRPQSRRSWNLDWSEIGLSALAAILVAVPFFAAFEIYPLLRSPVLETDLLASRAFQPRILTPMRSINASSDLRSAADELTAWAAGDSVDLWKPVGTVNPPPRVAFKPAPRIHEQPKQPVTPPANGSNLLPPLSGGAGELRLSNHSGLAAIVKLVRRNGIIARAVYVAPNSAATIPSIGVGVYDLYMDLGDDLDAEHLRFANSRFSPAPLGPFRFAEITSETGVTGNRYDVVLNPR
jgi:DnaJ domain